MTDVLVVTGIIFAVFALTYTLTRAINRRRFQHYLDQRWRRLPDMCEVDGCQRTGVLGNENIVKGMIVCDDCHARSISGQELKLRRT